MSSLMMYDNSITTGSILTTTERDHSIIGMLVRIASSWILLCFATAASVEGKSYEFAHGYDPDEKYGDTNVHFENMAGLRYECVQDIQKEIVSVFQEHLEGKEV